MSINSKLSDFINVPTNLSKENCLFLTDSEADVSIIKIGYLENSMSKNTNEIIPIRGITQEKLFTLGSIMMDIQIENAIFEHKFHLVNNNFPIPTHGILGKDFLKENKCVLNYETMTLTVNRPEIPVSTPLLSKLLDGSTLIPPRSTNFKICRIVSEEFPCVIEPQEIASNIFIPTTIAYSPCTHIRILNTNEDVSVLNLDNINIKTHPISEYDMYQPNTDKNSCRSNELNNILSSKIPNHAKNKLLPLCNEFAHIFHLSGDEPSVNNFYKAKLLLKDSEPVYTRNYRLPQSQKAEIKSQVNKLLEKDLIELSVSDYSSPLIVVPKKSTEGQRKWRLCVDYKKLNQKLINDKFPLPRMDDIFDSLGKAQFFSIMDLESGYHQIELENDSRKYTAFTTDRGHYQFKVLPFGLSIAPSSFNRMMSIAFSGLSPDIAFTYMDDLIVIGFSEKNHIQNLRKVFETCSKFNLKLNPSKCEFFKTEVNFLGHICSSEGLKTDPAKLRAVQNYPRPTDKDAVRRFVAFANYYRQFVASFAQITRPLTQLTRKRALFKWSTKCETAFQTLKEKLLTTPILKYPDFSKKFKVIVDASDFACGAVLTQEYDNVDMPITYISKSFKKGELNKPPIEKELLAVHFAVTTFRPYLYGTHFEVKSDHKPLIYLYNLKNPTSKLQRIRLELEEYDFEIHYIKGKDNVIADALSRLSINDLREMHEESTRVLAITRSMAKLQNSTSSKKDSINEIPTKIQAYTELSHLAPRSIPALKTTSISYDPKRDVIVGITLCVFKKNKNRNILFDICLENENLSIAKILSKVQKAARHHNIKRMQMSLADKLFKLCSIDRFKSVCNDSLDELQIILCKEPTQISSEQEKLELMQKFHNDPIVGGHCGQKKLYARLRQYYYWKQMTRDIAKFIKDCRKCMLAKPRHKNIELMHVTETPVKPFDIVVVDTIGPLRKSNSGNEYVLTMMCDLSKYLVSVPLVNKSAEAIARAMVKNLILVYGPIKQIKSDLGTEYKNSLMREVCKLLEIKQAFSTAHHHETVGTIERNHRVFNEYMRIYLDQALENWDSYLDFYTFCYNTSKNTTNNFNYSPYEIIFGRESILPNELFSGVVDPIYDVENYSKELKYILQTVHQNTVELVKKMKIRSKQNYDNKAKPLGKLNVGEQVLLEVQPYHKFKNKYSGPHTFVEEKNSNATLKTIDNKFITVHKNRIRKM